MASLGGNMAMPSLEAIMARLSVIQVHEPILTMILVMYISSDS